MKNKKIFYVIPLIILVWLLFKSNGFIGLSSSKNDPSSAGSPAFQKEKTGKNGKPGPSDMPDFKEAEAKYLGAVKKAEAPDQSQIAQIGNPLDVQSEAKLKEFRQIAKLEFKPPAKMRFMKLDLVDEGIEGTYGSTNDGKSGLAVLASSQLIGEDAVRNFLQSSSDEIPSLKNKNVNWKEKPEHFPAPEGSGISEAKVWTGTDASGNSFAAALLSRQDRSGTYFFIYNTHGKGVFENEGYFDKVFSDIKALDH
ncbi:MAG: hypothetical protein ACXVB1_07290 [Pseudobdellovibrionaceae bacterium]